jgi:hypothetical protein
MDNVQKHNSCINIPFSQALRSYSFYELTTSHVGISTELKDTTSYATSTLSGSTVFS